ncbi:MAG: CHAT domain-containing protein [Planctomycetales bacterium]
MLQIEAEDPGLLSWPWETLIDPEAGPLASSARIERRLNQHVDPLPLPETLPKDAVNILLVTARPYDHDVSYRSISRPLLDLVEKQKLPANVTLLRPATLERLREHLSSERPGYYHILHFDGHGSYRVHDKAGGNVDSHRLSGPEGHLVFEDATGEPDAVTAETLSTLLREHRIPAVVLNACQSAMADDRVADPFASSRRLY